MHRIQVEELCLDFVELVVTSIRKKSEEQWGLHDGFDLGLNRNIRHQEKHVIHCYGCYMPQMTVSANNDIHVEIKLLFLSICYLGIYPYAYLTV